MRKRDSTLEIEHHVCFVFCGNDQQGNNRHLVLMLQMYLVKLNTCISPTSLAL